LFKKSFFLLQILPLNRNFVLLTAALHLVGQESLGAGTSIMDSILHIIQDLSNENSTNIIFTNYANIK
jgi:hypothetical protein